MLKRARFIAPIEALALISVELFEGFTCAAVDVPPQDAAAKKMQVTSSNKYRLMPVIWVLSI